ncbi:MAG: glycosyltransferase family 2 protein, partial [Bacteroidota bacterium]|nr:glycosyltransferase family 2 protein [Bacteroidota bacterium]
MRAISIIIPVFNKEAYLAETITSVLKQTYTHFELLLINDGSTDDSLKVMQRFKDARIRII